MKYLLLVSTLALAACGSKSDSGGATGAPTSTGGGGGKAIAASCNAPKMNICREYLAKDLEKGVGELKSRCTGEQEFAEKPCDHDAAAICTLKEGVDYYYKNHSGLKSVEKWCTDTGGSYAAGTAHI